MIKAIVPIVRIDSNNEVKELLGTGFFVEPRKYFITAKHVFIANPLLKGEKYAVMFSPTENQLIPAYINSFLCCDKYDIATFDAGNVPGVVTLKFKNGLLGMNEDVITFEYSQTRIERDHYGKIAVFFEPFTHKGNIMRYYTSVFPDTTPTPSFDTSFPALQGSSGAPVLDSKDLSVVGMLVANHERHLIPAQIISIIDGDKRQEEIRYFLPTGKAIQGSIITEYLKNIQLSEDKIELLVNNNAKLKCSNCDNEILFPYKKDRTIEPIRCEFSGFLGVDTAIIGDGKRVTDCPEIRSFHEITIKCQCGHEIYKHIKNKY